jgi:hypothetical protein
MADTDTAPTTPPAIPTQKPGWKTSEFYKGIAVLALVTLLGSGVIPTTGVGAQITAIAGVVLTFLGYAGARTWLKGSGAALLFLVVLAPSTGCSAVSGAGKTLANHVVDCTVGASKAAAVELGPILQATIVQAVSADKPDFAPVKALAKGFTAEVGGCALASAVAVLAKAWEGTPKTLGQQLDPVGLRVEFRELAAMRFDGATFHTSAGDL